MNEYTKGEWNISSSVMVVCDGKIIHNGIPTGMSIMDVSYEEAIANARLIAACPRMFEALKELSNMNGMMQNLSMLNEPLQDKITAALALASSDDDKLEELVGDGS